MIQPNPQQNEEAPSWDFVIRDIIKQGLDSSLMLIQDIQQRNELGARKYGTYLQPWNGRDSVRDAYEESLDMTVYLYNAFREGASVYLIYRQTLRAAYELRMLLYRRDGR